MKARIRWDMVRSRLTRSEKLLEEGLSPTPERVEQVYRERAERLAAKNPVSPNRSALLHAMVFRVGAQSYAIEMKYLAEVVSSPQIVAIPGASPEFPTHFLGTIQVRGEIRSVLCVARLLNIPVSPPGPHGLVLLLKSGTEEIGVRADSVDGFREIPADSMTPAQTPMLKGIHSGSLMIVDVEAVLAAIYGNQEAQT